MSQTPSQPSTAKLKSNDSPGYNPVEHGSNNDVMGATRDHEQSTLEEDPNPRTSKRPRLSPINDDTEIDFEAAAARALAISLGVDQVGTDSTPMHSHAHGRGLERSLSVEPQKAVMSPDQQARIDNLPNVDDAANQILSTLAKLTHLEIGEMLFGPPSQRGQDYRAQKLRFEQVKRMYLTTSPFISIPTLGLQEPDQIEILRKTNMATFMASIFSGEIGLRIMDINFLDVFVPENGKLLKAQASIYLELKTQAFIAAKRTAPAMLDQVMLDLFPNDMEKYLLAKRPGAKSLAPSESDFLKRLASRRDILYADIHHKRLDNLELRYKWDDFSREVNSYLSKNYDQSGKEKEDHPSPSPARAQLAQEQMESQFSVDPAQNNLHPAVGPNSTPGPDLDFDLDDFMAQAARAAEIALRDPSPSAYMPTNIGTQPFIRSLAQSPPVLIHPTKSPATLEERTQASLVVATPAPVPSPTPPVRDEVPNNVQVTQTEFQQYIPATTESQFANTALKAGDNDEGVPHRSQTAPTQVLYERARLVTTNKASPLSRKPNPPSNRRPWTNEEENALMTGLDQVKGPHWSQILAMYGPGGTINESLKDRNQVQLKDKARNLKLFFLKAGIEVPYYLQAVTGDLKTRAPGQAEKREAKERERVNIEEDDIVVQQDELQTEAIDDADVATNSLTEREDVHAPTSSTVEASHGQQEGNGTDPSGEDEDAFDFMIARAAASATESLTSPWP